MCPNLKAYCHSIKTWLNIPIKTSQLTIFLFGRGGSGKTTFIKSILSSENLNSNYSQSSTEYVEYYKGEYNASPKLNKRFGKKYKVPIVIADYKGQTPQQALELKKKFMSQVNAMIFIVDVVHPDPESRGDALSYQELMEYLSSKTKEKIEYRVKQHISYLGDSFLSVLFPKISSVNRNKLKSVRLVINKIDIVQQLIMEGYLSHDQSPEDYARNQFEYIERQLDQACRQNGIPDLEIQAISLIKGTHVRDLIQGLILNHLKNLNIR
ncbi:MAG: GTPase domain-containing protein [Pleurocapsa sp. MO_226.B13]|nr:GTPase domain-containing protein [Pleurocapsa sp. MO_226.B13]